ncbi:hypothetical protein V5P93_004110 [Actinokineospora auranticolor]|uniref:Uncharacterized protein n=1 Tax=Actinokineospora auranticolor TaxID=155976 RepID=A0A2S6GD45_9PSEU|nr:hypothetical protein [Actinokineospora auranticolor]PPK63174.1 hypothetical protein CLV40_13143 [Actinokineospora auranticolor]
MGGHPESRNEVRGRSGLVVQAQVIHGGVHLPGAATGPALVARPVDEWDPFDLDVHRAIHVEGGDALPPLPRYLPREHDDLLDEVPARPDTNPMVVPTGDSSTGKTRALRGRAGTQNCAGGRWSTRARRRT